MKKEKPKPLLVRFYKNERQRIKKAARAEKVSEAEIVRRCIVETLVDYEHD